MNVALPHVMGVPANIEAVPVLTPVAVKVLAAP
jgi:hypothetical protein